MLYNMARLNDSEVKMKKNLLFVTYHDEDCDEGLSYAIDLAKIMGEGITILMVYKNRLIKKFDDLMTAITFAEAGEDEIAKSIMLDSKKEADRPEEKLNFLIEKCRESGVDVNVQTESKDIVSAVKDFLGKKTTIDMVLLSPCVTDNGNVTAKELQKLVKTVSRPIVTMAKQAHAV